MSAAPGPTGDAAGRLAALPRLVKAEDFFEVLAVPFVPGVLQVHRLHVLKRFSLELEQIDREVPADDAEGRLAAYREALRRSHDLFLRSTAQEEKLFKVFQGGGLVALTRRRA